MSQILANPPSRDASAHSNGAQDGQNSPIDSHQTPFGVSGTRKRNPPKPSSLQNEEYITEAFDSGAVQLFGRAVVPIRDLVESPPQEAESGEFGTGLGGGLNEAGEYVADVSVQRETIELRYSLNSDIIRLGAPIVINHIVVLADADEGFFPALTNVPTPIIIEDGEPDALSHYKDKLQILINNVLPPGPQYGASVVDRGTWYGSHYTLTEVANINPVIPNSRVFVTAGPMTPGDDSYIVHTSSDPKGLGSVRMITDTKGNLRPAIPIVAATEIIVRGYYANKNICVFGTPLPTSVAKPLLAVKQSALEELRQNSLLFTNTQAGNHIPVDSNARIGLPTVTDVDAFVSKLRTLYLENRKAEMEATGTEPISVMGQTIRLPNPTDELNARKIVPAVYNFLPLADSISSTQNIWTSFFTKQSEKQEAAASEGKPYVPDAADIEALWNDLWDVADNISTTKREYAAAYFGEKTSESLKGKDSLVKLANEFDEVAFLSFVARDMNSDSSSSADCKHSYLDILRMTNHIVVSRRRLHKVHYEAVDFTLMERWMALSIGLLSSRVVCKCDYNPWGLESEVCCPLFDEASELVLSLTTAVMDLMFYPTAPNAFRYRSLQLFYALLAQNPGLSASIFICDELDVVDEKKCPLANGVIVGIRDWEDIIDLIVDLGDALRDKKPEAIAHALRRTLSLSRIGGRTVGGAQMTAVTHALMMSGIKMLTQYDDQYWAQLHNIPQVIPSMLVYIKQAIPELVNLIDSALNMKGDSDQGDSGDAVAVKGVSEALMQLVLTVPGFSAIMPDFPRYWMETCPEVFKPLTLFRKAHGKQGIDECVIKCGDLRPFAMFFGECAALSSEPSKPTRMPLNTLPSLHKAILSIDFGTSERDTHPLSSPTRPFIIYGLATGYSVFTHQLLADKSLELQDSPRLSPFQYCPIVEGTEAVFASDVPEGYELPLNVRTHKQLQYLKMARLMVQTAITGMIGYQLPNSPSTPYVHTVDSLIDLSKYVYPISISRASPVPAALSKMAGLDLNLAAADSANALVPDSSVGGFSGLTSFKRSSMIVIGNYSLMPDIRLDTVTDNVADPWSVGLEFALIVGFDCARVMSNAERISLTGPSIGVFAKTSSRIEEWVANYQPVIEASIDPELQDDESESECGSNTNTISNTISGSQDLNPSKRMKVADEAERDTDISDNLDQVCATTSELLYDDIEEALVVQRLYDYSIRRSDLLHYIQLYSGLLTLFASYTDPRRHLSDFYFHAYQKYNVVGPSERVLCLPRVVSMVKTILDMGTQFYLSTQQVETVSRTDTNPFSTGHFICDPIEMTRIVDLLLIATQDAISRGLGFAFIKDRIAQILKLRSRDPVKPAVNGLRDIPANTIQRLDASPQRQRVYEAIRPSETSPASILDSVLLYITTYTSTIHPAALPFALTVWAAMKHLPQIAILTLPIFNLGGLLKELTEDNMREYGISLTPGRAALYHARNSDGEHLRVVVPSALGQRLTQRSGLHGPRHPDVGVEEILHHETAIKTVTVDPVAGQIKNRSHYWCLTAPMRYQTDITRLRIAIPDQTPFSESIVDGSVEWDAPMVNLARFAQVALNGDLWAEHNPRKIGVPDELFTAFAETLTSQYEHLRYEDLKTILSVNSTTAHRLLMEYTAVNAADLGALLDITLGHYIENGWTEPLSSLQYLDGSIILSAISHRLTSGCRELTELLYTQKKVNTHTQHQHDGTDGRDVDLEDGDAVDNDNELSDDQYFTFKFDSMTNVDPARPPGVAQSTVQFTDKSDQLAGVEPISKAYMTDGHFQSYTSPSEEHLCDTNATLLPLLSSIHRSIVLLRTHTTDPVPLWSAVRCFVEAIDVDAALEPIQFSDPEVIKYISLISLNLFNICQVLTAQLDITVDQIHPSATFPFPLNNKIVESVDFLSKVVKMGLPYLCKALRDDLASVGVTGEAELNSLLASSDCRVRTDRTDRKETPTYLAQIPLLSKCFVEAMLEYCAAVVFDRAFGRGAVTDLQMLIDQLPTQRIAKQIYTIWDTHFNGDVDLNSRISFEKLVQFMNPGHLSDVTLLDVLENYSFNIDISSLRRPSRRDRPARASPRLDRMHNSAGSHYVSDVNSPAQSQHLYRHSLYYTLRAYKDILTSSPIPEIPLADMFAKTEGLNMNIEEFVLPICKLFNVTSLHDFIVLTTIGVAEGFNPITDLSFRYSFGDEDENERVSGYYPNDSLIEMEAVLRAARMEKLGIIRNPNTLTGFGFSHENHGLMNGEPTAAIRIESIIPDAYLLASGDSNKRVKHHVERARDMSLNVLCDFDVNVPFTYDQYLCLAVHHIKNSEVNEQTGSGEDNANGDSFEQNEWTPLQKFVSSHTPCPTLSIELYNNDFSIPSRIRDVTETDMPIEDFIKSNGSEVLMILAQLLDVKGIHVPNFRCDFEFALRSEYAKLPIHSFRRLYYPNVIYSVVWDNTLLGTVRTFAKDNKHSHPEDPTTGVANYDTILALHKDLEGIKSSDIPPFGFGKVSARAGRWNPTLRLSDSKSPIPTALYSLPAPYLLGGYVPKMTMQTVTLPPQKALRILMSSRTDLFEIDDTNKRSINAKIDNKKRSKYQTMLEVEGDGVDNDNPGWGQDEPVVDPLAIPIPIDNTQEADPTVEYGLGGDEYYGEDDMQGTMAYNAPGANTYNYHGTQGDIQQQYGTYSGQYQQYQQGAPAPAAGANLNTLPIPSSIPSVPSGESLAASEIQPGSYGALSLPELPLRIPVPSPPPPPTVDTYPHISQMSPGQVVPPPYSGGVSHVPVYSAPSSGAPPPYAAPGRPSQTHYTGPGTTSAGTSNVDPATTVPVYQPRRYDAPPAPIVNNSIPQSRLTGPVPGQMGAHTYQAYPPAATSHLPTYGGSPPLSHLPQPSPPHPHPHPLSFRSPPPPSNPSNPSPKNPHSMPPPPPPH